jgi:hypothetical protein
MYRGPLPVGYWDIYDVMRWLHMQLVVVDQMVLDIVGQESHPGWWATVWITSLDFMLDSLKKQGKNAEQLGTCSAQSSARLFANMTFHIQNFVGNRSCLVVVLRFARCCSCWGPWSQTGGKTVKNSYVPGSRSDISARCGPFNESYFFSDISRGIWSDWIVWL